MHSFSTRYLLGLGLAATMLTAAPAAAEPPIFSPLDADVLEQTTLVPAATSVTAYTAPNDARVVLTRFCGDGCVRCAGTTVGSAAFETRGGRCIDHPRGLELPPGEAVQCTNPCSTTGAALFSGLRRP